MLCPFNALMIGITLDSNLYMNAVSGFSPGCRHLSRRSDRLGTNKIVTIHCYCGLAAITPPVQVANLD